MSTKEEILGRIPLSKATTIVVRKVSFDSRTFIDIRKYVETRRYTGYTQKGIMVPLDALPKLLDLLQGVVRG